MAKVVKIRRPTQAEIEASIPEGAEDNSHIMKEEPTVEEYMKEHIKLQYAMIPDRGLTEREQYLMVKYHGLRPPDIWKRIASHEETQLRFQKKVNSIDDNIRVKFKIRPEAITMQHRAKYMEQVAAEIVELGEFLSARDINRKVADKIKATKRVGWTRGGKSRRKDYNPNKPDATAFMSNREVIDMLQEEAHEQGYSGDISERSNPLINPGMIAYRKKRYEQEYVKRTMHDGKNEFKIWEKTHMYLSMEVFVKASFDGFDFRWNWQTMSVRKVRRDDPDTIVNVWEFEREDFDEMRADWNAETQTWDLISPTGRPQIIIE